MTKWKALTLLWFASDVAGLSLSVWRLQDALHNREALRATGANGLQMKVADRDIRDAALKTWIQMGHVTLGIERLLLPPLMAEGKWQHFHRVHSIWVFIVTSLTITLANWLDRRDRIGIRQALLNNE